MALLTGVLYLLQPLARLHGRIAHGLTPWRRRGTRGFRLPLPRTQSFWSERWQSVEDRMRTLCTAIGNEGAVVRAGGDWDRWDVQVRGGLLGAARLRMGIEEHGSGQQLIRVRSWPYAPVAAIALGAASGLVTVAAILSDADAATIPLGLIAAALVVRTIHECGAATATIKRALRAPRHAAAADVESQHEPLALGIELEPNS